MKVLPEYLEPFYRPRDGYNNANGLKKYPEALLKLCNDALELASLGRSSKRTFEFQCPEIGTQRDLDIVTIMAQEPGRRGDNSICVVLAPAMIKFPDHDPNMQLVLEKAHVVARIEQ
jgi:hypothetical protein